MFTEFTITELVQSVTPHTILITIHMAPFHRYAQVAVGLVFVQSIKDLKLTNTTCICDVIKQSELHLPNITYLGIPHCLGLNPYGNFKFHSNL